ncbi:hypothetical protein B7463_g12522, partial [Scytalidium lignicola]
MTEQSIKSLFSSAERQRQSIESSWDTNTAEYQQNLVAAIRIYEQCLELAGRLSLFSPNETIEDISSGDLQLAELLLRQNGKDRKRVLQQAREAYERYLILLDQYDILSSADKKLYNTYNEDPTRFSTISTSDPNARRAAKISNFKQEKELKNKLEFLAKKPAYLENDEEAVRELQLTNLTLCTYNTFQSLESINRELEVLAMAPTEERPEPAALERDYRERQGIIGGNEYSDRLDRPETFSRNNAGPILSQDGKPLRPFTLLDNRQTLTKGVFGPGHNLPTMTIDEYLEQERAMGNIIEGGGEASGIAPEPDEDNYEKADIETMKAREWDEFVEANPKGSGNTMNRDKAIDLGSSETNRLWLLKQEKHDYRPTTKARYLLGALESGCPSGYRNDWGIKEFVSTMAADFRISILKCFLFFLVVSYAEAFYIPGWSIKSYKEHEAIPLLVNKVYSDNTQLQYAYYDLPFVCPPTGVKHAGSSVFSGESIPLNLGEVLRGDRIMASDIELVMGEDQECHFLCSRTVTRKDLKRARELVRDGYVAEWIVDNLPGATSFVTVDKTRKYYAAGFKMGYKDYAPESGKPRYYINNHLTIVIRYRKAPGKAGENGGQVIVGFEVYTKSIGPENRLESGCPKDVHDTENPMELYLPPNSTDLSLQYPHSSYYPPESERDMDDGATLEIPYSYSVYFREDDKIEWAHRWDLYFVNQEEGSRIHWLAIINSLIISGLLSAIVAMILARTIRGDIKTYKDAVAEDGRLKQKRRSRPGSGARTPRFGEKSGVLEPLDTENDADVSSDDEPLEELTGWKLLHSDVFRAPPFGHLLAPLVGSGMQLVFMAVGLLFLSSLGILNPSFRGGFVSVGVGLFVFAGLFSGYFSARVYKTFGGLKWRKNSLVTATLFPGLLFAVIFILNLFVWAQASSTALPFGTLIGILVLWLCIQLPLVHAGSWYGYVRTGAWEHPTKTAVISRQIPPQPWYIRSPQSILLAGLIPFAVIFIELLFVFQSLWQDKSGYYYVFGFLSVVCIILILTIAEVTIVTIYIKLCSEDYNWWWHSFFVGGGSAAS